MTQAVRAFLTDCEEAAGHLRRLRILIECMPLAKDIAHRDWLRDRMMREVEACAESLGVEL